MDDPPNEMYVKTMRLPDFASKPADETALDRPTAGSASTLVGGQLSLILLFLECLTDVPDAEIAEMRAALENGAVNPMELKKRLARELVVQFHGQDQAAAAERNFERTVQQGETPDEMAVYRLPAADDLKGKRLSHLLANAGLAASGGEARRLIDQGAVSVNGETVEANLAADAVGLATDDVVRVGRGRYVRVVAP